MQALFRHVMSRVTKCNREVCSATRGRHTRPAVTARRLRVVKPSAFAGLDDHSPSNTLGEESSTTMGQTNTCRSHARQLRGVKGPLVQCLTTTVHQIQWEAMLDDHWSSKPGYWVCSTTPSRRIQSSASSDKGCAVPIGPRSMGAFDMDIFRLHTGTPWPRCVLSRAIRWLSLYEQATVFCRNIRRNIQRYWILRRICRSISCSAKRG
jgi:hypothetical protein